MECKRGTPHNTWRAEAVAVRLGSHRCAILQVYAVIANVRAIQDVDRHTNRSHGGVDVTTRLRPKGCLHYFSTSTLASGALEPDV